MVNTNPLKSGVTLTEVAEWAVEVNTLAKEVVFHGCKSHPKSSVSSCKKCAAKASASHYLKLQTEVLSQLLSSWGITASKSGRTALKISLVSSVGATQILPLVNLTLVLLEQCTKLEKLKVQASFDIEPMPD